ncbi:MAG: diguanylate cyclase [Gammaproteobacteria bacterium]|nr:diguanylate cyclase [Gammaproteobacteria bacterium]
MKSNPEHLKELKKLEILLYQSKGALFGGVIVAILVLPLSWYWGNKYYLLTWLLCYCLFSFLRYKLTLTSLTDATSMEMMQRIRHNYTLMTFLSGVAWGGISLYFLLINLDYGSVLVILAVSLTATSASLYAIYPSIFASFAFPALLPPTIHLLLLENNTANIYGVLVLSFLVLMCISCLRLKMLIMNSVGIQFENIRLLDDIEREKSQVSDLNKQLQSDLEELRKRDMQLSEEKDRAEHLAEKLLILSTRDGLTGIANRRHFDEYLAKEWNRAVRSSLELSLILCDIDFFKNYNDKYGHQQGDRCLQQVSSVLEDYTRREGDLAARYGGEEFAIILPDTTHENAITHAEKIRAAIEKEAIPHEASSVANIVTISMGLATIRPDRSVFSSRLIADADKLLYQAKSEGRNRLVASQSLLDETVQSKNQNSRPELFTA